MTRFFCAAALALVGLSAFAWTDYNWQAVDGDYSGDFTNALHWTPAPDPYPGYYDVNDTTRMENLTWFAFQNDKHKGLDVKVSYPSGVITNVSQYFFRVRRPMRFSLEGLDTTLVIPQPYTENHKWPTSPNWGSVVLRIGAGTSSYDQTLVQADFNGQVATSEGLLAFKDFRMSVTNGVGESRLEFETGSFAFKNIQYWKLFCGGIGNQIDQALQVDKAADVTVDGTPTFFTPTTNQYVRVRGGKLSLPYLIWSLGPYFTVATDATIDRLLEFSVTEGGTFDYGSKANSKFEFGLSPSHNKGDSSTTTVRLLADASTVTQTYNGCVTESYGPGPHELVLRHGSTGSFAGSIEFGKVAGAHGRIEVLDSAATFAGSVKLGGQSAAAVTGGGVCDLVIVGSTVTLGCNRDVKCSVYNGRVALTNATVSMAGGKARFLGDGTYGGARTFTADGATIEVFDAEGADSPVEGFDTATIGAGGLTIAAPQELTLTQSFAGDGTLTLSGAGAKTVSGDLSCAKVVVSGGPVTFTGTVTAEVEATDGATVSFAGLTTQAAPLAGLKLGNRAARGLGGLAVLPNETIWVDGAVDVQCLRVTIGGAPASGDTFAIACMRGASAENRVEWDKMKVRAGLPAETSWVTSVEDIGGGGVKLVATLGAQRRIALATDTHATNIAYGVGEELDVAPEKDARTDISGSVGYGLFVKSGGGAAYLSGANELLAGFVLDGGLLSFATGAALNDTWESSPSTVCDGTLEFLSETTLANPLEIRSSVADNGLVVLKTEADVTMPVPKMTRGAFVKRGRGRLTFEVEGDADWSALRSGSGAVSAGEQMVFDDVNGTAPAPTTSYGAVNVAEGELVLRGVGATKPTVSLKNTYNNIVSHTVVGIASVPEPANPAQPGLVLDHVAYNPVDGHSGGGEEIHVSRRVTEESASFLTAPYLYVTNGASMKVNALALCGNSKNDRVHAELLLDNGTITSYYEFRFSQNYWETTPHHTTNSIVMRNGSGLYAGYGNGRLILSGTSARFDVDGSTLARNVDGAPLGVFFADRTVCGADMTFRNGSYFGCYMIGMNGDSSPQDTAKSYIPVNLRFDDSEWFVGEGARDIPCSNLNIAVTATGKGLKLNPPADANWRLYTRVGGDAGIVKGGAGTLFVDNWYKFHVYQKDPVALACTGTNVIAEGTLRFRPTAVAANPKFFFRGAGGTLELDDAASVATNVTVGGTGTLGAGVWQGLTVVPRFGAVLTVDGANGATLAGRTFFDFGGDAAEAQKFVEAPVVVAEWTGDAPDVSRWRTRNAGLRGKLVFVAEDGTVTAQLKEDGLMVIVR